MKSIIGPVTVKSLVFLDDVRNDVDPNVSFVDGDFDLFHDLKMTTAQVDKRLEPIVIENLLQQSSVPDSI